MSQPLEWDADTDSAQRASRVVALRALDSMAEARDAIARRDTESVHKFRVDLRRLRSWIRVYRPCLGDTVRQRTMQRFERIAETTTELRDLDVQISWLRSETSALGETRLEAAKWVLKSLKRNRRSAWKRFSRVLDRDYSRSQRALERQLTYYTVIRDIRTRETVPRMRPVTAQLLREQAAKLTAALSRIRSPDDTKRLHRARIVAKRTRYVLEALESPSLGLAGVAEELTRFQDLVGELRDAQLLAHRVSREITTVAAERTALVASELVYRPLGAIDFSRVVGESPFDTSLSLLFARLHDRIAIASRAVSSSLDKARSRDWIAAMTPRGTSRSNGRE